jgi:hypothetical protein
MKHFVQAFVVVLVLTGVAATTQTSAASTKVTVSRTSMVPVPMCAPNDPNACGMR